MKKILILGAAGFLGHHLEHRMKAEGHYVVSVARKHPPYRKSVANEFNILDLTNVSDFHSHFFRHQFDECYALAGEVGGLGYISEPANDAAILTNSLKINLHTLEAIARTGNCKRIFFASSHCVYPNRHEIDPFAQERLTIHRPNSPRETNAQFDGNMAFAKEKLYAEALYTAMAAAHGFEARIGRLGNTYGPYCTWEGPRAKSVAALCRKVAEAPYAGVIDVWGDGQQTRSFTYVDDVIEGMVRLMASDCREPVNIAHGEPVRIGDLVDTICNVAGKIVGVNYTDGPVGPRHRGSDNEFCKHVLGWEPSIGLRQGLELTYPWIKEQVLTRGDG